MSMLGPMAGQADQLLKQLQETVEKSVREVRLTVSWKAGKKEESFELVEHVVILPNAGQAAAQAAQVQDPASKALEDAQRKGLIPPGGGGPGGGPGNLFNGLGGGAPK